MSVTLTGMCLLVSHKDVICAPKLSHRWILTWEHLIVSWETLVLLFQKMTVSLMDQSTNTIASDGRRSQGTLLVVLVYVLLAPAKKEQTVWLVAIFNNHITCFLTSALLRAA